MIWRQCVLRINTFIGIHTYINYPVYITQLQMFPASENTREEQKRERRELGKGVREGEGRKGQRVAQGWAGSALREMRLLLALLHAGNVLPACMQPCYTPAISAKQEIMFYCY